VSKKWRDGKREPEVAVTPAPVPVPVPVLATVTALPEREITLEAFASTVGTLGVAFAATERLGNGGRQVKRTRTVWNERYAMWLTVTR